MHPNPAFRTEPRDRNLTFARERGFGVLSVNGDAGPLMAHVPFILSEDGTTLDTHLLRSNPVLHALPAGGVMAVSGPDGYISPDWYETPDQVPTWNYVAVHLRGQLTARPANTLRDLLDRQTDRFEEDLPGPNWTADKMPADLLDRMMRTIVPVRLQIEDVQGTWKLGQNKTPQARHAAAQSLEAFGTGPDARLLSALMRGLTES